MPTLRTLAPIVAIPTDGAGWNPDWPTALDTAIDTALCWWAVQLGRCPFKALPAIVIGFRRPAADYFAQPNTQELIQAELAAYWPELGQAVDTGPLYAVYADLGQGPYQCPGNVIGTSYSGPNDATLIVQSSTSLDAFLGLTDDDRSGVQTRDAQTGALAHELGHALTLPHPSNPEEQRQTVMYDWWAFPHIGTLPGEVTQVNAFLAGWPDNIAAA